MPDPVTAIAGSAVLGAGTSILGSRSASKSASAAQSSADAASALQYQASQDQLEFAKQQYSDWENIFGPIQSHLSNYYQNLHPDTYASLGIQNIEKEYARSSQLLDENLAKRGMTNSGATTQGFSQLESARMLGRAEAQTNAPMAIAQAQQGFLNAGLGIQGSVLSGINSSYGNQVSLLGQQATNNLQSANQYRNSAAQSMAGVGSSVGAGIQNYLVYNALQPSTTYSAGVQSGSFVNSLKGVW